MHWVVQFIGVFLAGFLAGYLYRSYKLGFELADKSKFEELLEGYGIVEKPFAVHYAIEILIKTIILVLIGLMIYFSVYPQQVVV